MTDQEIQQFTTAVLDGGVRVALRRVIGDRTPAQYDKADAIAESVANGIRNALGGLGVGAFVFLTEEELEAIAAKGDLPESVQEKADEARELAEA